MNINVERLIGVAQEALDADRDYRLECRKKPQWKRTQEEERSVFYRERENHYTNNAVSDLCAILNIDWRKLYVIARLARKWEQKHDWQRCFPVQANEQKILDYLQKDDDKPWSWPNIQYIHWKINTGAYRKDYEMSLRVNKKTA